MMTPSSPVVDVLMWCCLNVVWNVSFKSPLCSGAGQEEEEEDEEDEEGQSKDEKDVSEPDAAVYQVKR